MSGPTELGQLLASMAAGLLGPISVFEGTVIPSRGVNAFELYTVAESTKPVEVSGGLKIVPRFTFENAPQPKVVLIPEQSGSEAMVEWIKARSKDGRFDYVRLHRGFPAGQDGLTQRKNGDNASWLLRPVSG